MATLPQTPPAGPLPAGNPLTECLVALAGTPDDSAWLDCQLTAVGQFVADLVMAVDEASVTVQRDGADGTVAASETVAGDPDGARYAAERGPDRDPPDGTQPTAVSDHPATAAWAGCPDAVLGPGVRTSLSVPLFAGRGTPVAVLQLSGHDPDAMAALSDAVRAAFDVSAGAGCQPPTGAAGLDDGGVALVAGLRGALAVRDGIQQAIGVLLAARHRTSDGAYLALRLRAAETGMTLAETASEVIAESAW